MDLAAERWEGITPAEREGLARRLTKQLPSGFTFRAIRRFRLGEWQHHVALYQQDNATFALIPGALVSLGYDADRPWEPNPDELESWQGTSEEYGIDKTIREYIAEVTLRVRRVELSPFLIETTAGELGWEPIGIDDAEVQGILREYSQGQAEVSRGDVSTRVRRDEEGQVIARMGNFYTNYTLRGPSQQAVAAALAGRSAIVTPAQDSCIVVFDEQSEEQDSEVIAELASHLSRELSCPVLALLNHDDDILWYQLYLNGELADEYDSSPGYFDAAAEPSAPTGGDAQKLCSAFGASAVSKVESILRKSAYDDSGYIFAVDRHADLARALGIPSFGVGAGYRYVSEGELPEGLSEEDLVRT